MKKAKTRRSSPDDSSQKRVNPAYERPFEVSPTAIANLNSDQFVAFITYLLRAEIALYGGPPSDLAGNFAPGPDKGRDATTWRSHPPRDSQDTLIPYGMTVWQCKAEQKPPNETEFAEELSKEKPLTCLEGGGHYVFVAQKPSHDEDDIEAILRSIALSFDCDENRVYFLAQHKIAEFARRHPTLALLEFFPTRPKGLEPFEIWQRDHASIPFEPSAHAAKVQELQNGIRQGTRFHVAVTGPTGVGKSRLVLETIRQMELESSVAYAASPGPQVDSLIGHIRMDGVSCIVIVDECDEANTEVLRSKLATTTAGLITIGADREGSASRAPGGDTLVTLSPLPDQTISKVLEGHSGLSPDMRSWIAANTGGYIRLATLVGDELARDPGSFGSLAQLSAVTTVENALKRMLGDDPQRINLLKLIACFANVGHSLSGGQSEICELAARLNIRSFSLESLCSTALRKHILADIGSYYYVTPDLLAQWLLESFLRVHSATFKEWLPELPERLRNAHFRQLEHLRGSPSGKQWASRLVEPTGPFGDLLAVRQPWAEQALLALSAAAKDAAIAYVASWASRDTEAPSRIGESRALQHLLFRLMRLESGFSSLFGVLVDAYDLAGASNSGPLWDLLRGMLVATGLSSTLAPYSTVLTLVENELRHRSPGVRLGLLRALGSGIVRPLGTAYSEYDRDPDDHGRSRTTHDEARRAIDILKAALDNPHENISRYAAAFFIKNARVLIGSYLEKDPFIAISRAIEITSDIGSLAQELDAILAYDRPPPELAARIHQLRTSLAGDILSRVRLVVAGWNIVDRADNAALPHRPDVESVASEVLALPDGELPLVVSLIFKPEAKNPAALLMAIAQYPECVRVWEHLLVQGRVTTNPWPCSRFLASARDAGHPIAPSALELLASGDVFDREVAANALTMSVATAEEIEVLADSLRSNLIHPNWTRACYMARWNERVSAQAIISLIKGLVGHSQGSVVAIGLISRALDSKQAVPPDLIVRSLTASISLASGHDQWIWEQVGLRFAEISPGLLFNSLVDSIYANGPGRMEDELKNVLTACCRREPALAGRLLELWERHPYFVAHDLGGILAEHISSDRLAEWAGGDVERQSALGRMVVASDAPLTVDLVERLGENSIFARELEASAGSGSWSGGISGFYAGRGAEWMAYAERASTPRFRKLAERIGQRLLASAEQARRDEADEEALER